MACGAFFQVDIKQSVSWVVLWCICRTCVADFSSRNIIFMVPFFLTNMASTRQHTSSCAALCEISRCYLSFLPKSTLHHSFGCVVLGLLWSQQDFEWRWSVPLFKCLTVLEFSFILFDLCLLITFFNFIMNYVPIVTFWIFTYHKIWILSIMFCFIWSYWIIYFFSMFGSVLESCELTGVCLLLPWLIKWK